MLLYKIDVLKSAVSLAGRMKYFAGQTFPTPASVVSGIRAI